MPDTTVASVTLIVPAGATGVAGVEAEAALVTGPRTKQQKVLAAT